VPVSIVGDTKVYMTFCKERYTGRQYLHLGRELF